MSLNIPLFTCGDNFQLNCFGNREANHVKRNTRDVRDLADIYEKQQYDIVMLPIIPDFFKMDNLYPPWNHVDEWDIFMVGNDKTYILANVNSFKTSVNLSQHLLNNRAAGIVDEELAMFLDPLWDKTLAGSQLQFFMEMREQQYIVNTFHLTNMDKTIVGAVMLLRPFTFKAIAGHSSKEMPLEFKNRSHLPLLEQLLFVSRPGGRKSNESERTAAVVRKSAEYDRAAAVVRKSFENERAAAAGRRAAADARQADHEYERAATVARIQEAFEDERAAAAGRQK
jgi:hypothetical protein